MTRYLIIAAATLLSACGGDSTDVPDISNATPAVPRPTLAELPEPYNEADIENGRIEFRKCHNCHGVDLVEGNKVGPNLHGVFDRKPGTASKFRYSQPLQNIALESWTPEEIDKWLANPKSYLPGSSMFFNGIDNANTRRDVIAYLLIYTR